MRTSPELTLNFADDDVHGQVEFDFCEQPKNFELDSWADPPCRELSVAPMIAS